MTPQQILDRLQQRLPLLTGGARDLPERQRTLRATIEWSYELLTDEEQRLFARLAVFAGGSTLEDAELVAGADVDTLQLLLDKSLVRHSRGRWWMLETIREYAAERLDELADRDELRRRHAEHFLELAEEAQPHLPAYEVEWVERLDREHDNIRLALDWLEACGENGLLQRLAGALARFWLVRGHAAEGRGRLERAVAADDEPTPARLKALNGAAMLAQVEAQRRYAEAALSLAEKLDNRAELAQAKLALAGARSADDMAAARQLYEESAEAFRGLGEEHQVLIATRSLAWACLNLGEVERGRQLHEENLRRARALGNTRIEAITLGALAMSYVEEGDLEVARPLLKESHRLHEQVADPIQTAFDAFRFAMLLAEAHEAETAATVLSAADALAAKGGINLTNWDPGAMSETLAKIRDRLDEGALAAAFERGRALTADQAFSLALEKLGD